MKTWVVKKWAVTVFLLIFILSVPRWVAAETTFSRIVVFGTSLSDPGNAFALRGGTTSPPYSTLGPLRIPAEPYSIGGGHHFTNGETWIEQLARSLGLAENTRPAFQESGSGATNYAVGGARAYDDGKNVNLSEQVNKFLHDFGGAAPSDALYVIEMGGNDLLDTLAGGGNGGAIIPKALSAIGDNIVALHRAGARKFLVWNVPNIGLTPAVQSFKNLIPAAGQLAELASVTFNSGLDLLLDLLKEMPGIEIVQFDLYRKVNEMIASPGSVGLSVVDATCVMPDIPPFECRTPDEFFFWDGIHPTRAVHAMVATQVALTLAVERGDAQNPNTLNPLIRKTAVQ